MLSSTKLLSIKITTSIKKDIIEEVEKYLSLPQADSVTTIFSVNSEIVVDAQKNNFFRYLLNDADINLPDGAGVVWGLKHVSSVKCHVSRISGIDFMQDLIKLASQMNYPIAFIGGRNGIAQQSLDKLKNKYPGLEGWAIDSPEIFIQNNQLVKLAQLDKSHPIPPLCQRGGEGGVELDQYFIQLTQKIVDSNIKIVFVGLGAPKQEVFINELQSQLSIINYQSSIVLMSVGGAFDILSGKLPRAPKIIQQLNLEWLWRLILEPKRIFRQLKLIKFVYLIIKSKKFPSLNTQ